MGRRSTFPGQVGPGGPAAFVAPLPLRGQRRDRAKALTGFPIFRTRRRVKAPRWHQISTQDDTPALVGATEHCSFATSVANRVDCHAKAAQIASKPSVSAAGPGWRMYVLFTS
jgi:hypothetical protein